ncbi:hypothetical protein [Bradyrhizobium sp. S3.9.1]|uniref:hypothetical protein n=1 Tax=Bradyrhizobium sp. S3.9.1 TaxID=3156431 RepID=UPI00339AD7E3
MDLDRIAVDYAGLPDYFGRTSCESRQNENRQSEPENSIYSDFQDDLFVLQNQGIAPFCG